MEEDLEKKMKNAYKNVFKNIENRPENWAKKKSNGNGIIFPAIPFIGNNFKKTKLLLYASAENLVGYSGNLDNDTTAINRRRYCYNNCYNNRDENFYFPDVHIRPVEDGSLIIVAAYILKLLGKELEYENPYEFIEYIAVDNFAKFSIATNKKNKDYANDITKLRASFEYVKKDLAILNPNIIILPKTIHDHEEVQTIIKETVPFCKIIPIFQINSRNINIRISKSKEPKDSNAIDTILNDWQKHLSNGITGKTNENFYSVYTYLDDIVQDSHFT